MSTSPCRDCGQTLYWHESKSGRKYPANSENRRDFHQCSGAPPAKPTPKQTQAPQQPAPNGDLQSRVAWLEKEVRTLLIRVDALEPPPY